MPFKRALVECAVLSLQDSCVMYPSCKGCFSRVNTDTQGTRLTCSRCGYSCVRSVVDHRYRLSIRVARGSCMFGLTVFGNCLNQFFGINASGLQRLVADKSGALETSKSTLLVKAVEDCFIGKHFIFGVKVTENDIEPWVKNTKGTSHMTQLIATQMILPKAAGLRGCTVLHYYEAVLQKALESKQSTLELYKTEKDKGKPLWPSPHNSPTPIFANDTLHSSGFLPWSLSRSQHLDSSLSPTPPWQQKLGLITSSAEQEESSNDDNKSPCFREKCRRSVTPLKAWLDLSTPANKTNGLPTLPVNNYSMSDITNSIPPNCPGQDEYPLSESLTEFLKDKNKLDHSQQNKTFSELVHDDIDFMDKSQVCDGNTESKTAATNEPSEANEDEQSESSIYNCSADLFSSSPRLDINITSFAPSPACNVHASVDLLHTQSRVDSSSLTSKQLLSENENDQKHTKCQNRESFWLGSDFDFIPPSQSTPAVRVTRLHSDLLTRHKSESPKDNTNSANPTTLHGCVTPKSRNIKPEKNKYGLLTKKRLSACRGLLQSTVYKRRLSGFVHKNNALIVPPTPCLRKTSLFKHYKEQTLNITSKKENFQLQTESKADCKSSQCGQAVDKSDCTYVNEEFDCSRDLFSDSV